MIAVPHVRADEVPSGLCSLQIPYDGLTDEFDEEARPLLERSGAGWSVAYAGSTLSTIVDDGNPDSPDGDEMRLQINLDVTVVGVQTRQHFFADFKLRQTPPAVAFPHSCQYGRVTSTSYSQVGSALRRCNPQIDQPQDCVTHEGYDYYTGDVDPTLALKAEHEELLEPGVSGAAPQGCHVVYFEDCAKIPLHMGIPACAQNPGESLAILCVYKHIDPVEVILTEDDFPGPYATGLSNDLPGMMRDEPRVVEQLGAQGILDQQDFGGVFYQGSCYLQKMLSDNLDPLLGLSTQMGTLELSVRDLILAGGGIRISEPNQSVFLLIPSLYQEHDSPGSCTWRPDNRSVGQPLVTDLLSSYDDGGRAGAAQLLRDFLTAYVDFPKIMSHFVEAEPQAADGGIRIWCNLGQDCSVVGDDDQDGFCNDVDLCPTQVTSANCDNDGDGHGDGVQHLVVGGWTIEPGGDVVFTRGHCFGEGELEEGSAFEFPGYLNAGAQTRQRLLNFACGACDNCMLRYNPDTWAPNPLTPHELELPAVFVGEDFTPSPVTQPTWQPDLDNDWIGDACDPDVDGDGLRNEHDCEMLNPLLGIDVDGDGMCEQRAHPDTTVGPDFDAAGCVATCEANEDLYRWFEPSQTGDGAPYVPTSECKAGCWKGIQVDNCAPSGSGSDSWCNHVIYWCLDPDLTKASYAQHCSPEQVSYCAMQYANPGQPVSAPTGPDTWDQPDFDGDGTGDKCDHGAFGLELEPSQRFNGGTFGPTARFGCNWIGEHYTVRMRNYGGNAQWTQGDSHPVYDEQTRTAFEVGACACWQDSSTSGSAGGLDWLELCWDDRCPDNDDPANGRGEEDLFRRKYWNPISEPAYAEDHPNGCAGLSCATDAERREQSIEGHLVYGRRQSFTRDEGANLLELFFDWQYAKQAWWPSGTDYEDAPDAIYRASAATPPQLTRARATWPDYQSHGEPIVYDYDRESGISYSDAVRVELRQGACQGEVYLGPPFVLAIIPGVVDGLAVDPGAAWRGDRAALPSAGQAPLRVAADVLGWNDSGDELLLYRHGENGFGLKVAQRFFGAALDPRASVTAATGAVDGAFWGLADGRAHEAILIYQQPYAERSSGPTHGGAQVPSRLFVGRLSEGETVLLEDAEAFSDRATPSLHQGRVMLQPRSGQALILGRAGSEEGPWRLARLSLATGRWSAPRRVDLPAAERLLAAELDPARGQILVITASGDSGAGDEPSPAPAGTLRARWLHPTTLAITAAAPPSPWGAARDQGAVIYDRGSRRVWIAGGERAGTALDDVWRLDLRRQTWSEAATLPHPVGRPMVSWDAARRLLWVAEHRVDMAGLDVAAYDPEAGSWIETFAPLGPRAVTWPVDDTYVWGRTYAYPYAVSESTPLPGELLLARLQADAPWLTVEIRSLEGDRLATGALDGLTGEPVAAALCPAGRTCELVVRPAGGGAAGGVPFTLQAETAALSPAGTVAALGFGRSLSARGDRLYLTGPAGIRVLRASTLDELGWISLPGLHGGRAGAPCGSHICLVRPGKRGFQVVDVTQPQSPIILGTTHLGQRPPRDLAVYGARAFVARGRDGVTRVDVTTPGQPTVKGTLPTTGRAVAVAVGSGLLAVGTARGEVTLYDLSTPGPPVAAGALQAGFRLSRVRLVARQLLALDSRGQTAEMWRVDDPAHPVRLGSFQQQAAPLTTGLWRGRRLYALERNQLRMWRAE